MVITKTFVVRSYLNVKEDAVRPWDKLLKSAKSSLTVKLSFKGCTIVRGPTLHMTDIECYVNRILIGRVGRCDLCIPDDARISRYHSTIECSSDGQWSYRDLGSKSGSSLKLKSPVDEFDVPKFTYMRHKSLGRKKPYLIQNHDVIMIGRDHQGHAHELTFTIHRPGDDDTKSDEGLANPQALGADKLLSRRLTWRRSLHCNACMGWGRRHSCSVRLSQLQKMILDCNSKANVKAPRPIKTAVQKALFHRVSGWWPKKPDKSRTFKVPARYESDIHQHVGGLPDEPVIAPRKGRKTDEEDVDDEGETDEDDGGREVRFDDMDDASDTCELCV